MSDEFYIGYQKKAPPGLARKMRILVVLLSVGLAAFGAVAAYLQSPVDRGSYEFGVTKEFDAFLYGAPLPHVRLASATEDFPVGTALLLVDQGKYGVPPFAMNALNHRVRFAGSLIRRGGAAMVEMAGEAQFEVGQAMGLVDSDHRTIGEFTLEGELVDTKCFLGVMRPGAGKVHRACASNCLRGGVQPGLLVRTNNGYDTAVLLADATYGALEVNHEWAARTVRASGVLMRIGDLLVLKTSALELAR